MERSRHGRLRAGGAGDPRPRADARQARVARGRGGRGGRGARRLSRDVRRGVPVVALGEGVRGLAERCRTADVRAARAELGRGRRAAERRLAAVARELGDLARHRRQRGRAGAARDDLQRAPLPLARRRARAAPPQAHADEPRAARLGARRRARARGGRDRLRPGRRADLLGELHAARARRALRVRRRDLRRVDRGRRATHGRRRSSTSLARAARTSSRPACSSAPSSYPDDFPLRDELDGDELLGRGGSAILAPDGSYLAGPLYGEEGDPLRRARAGALLGERQRFDPVGHYSRPDVLRLEVRGVRPRV